METIVQLLQAVAILLGSVVAVWGINAWRRELRGKREHELAEEVLSLVYDCRDRLRAIRSLVGWSGEGKTRQPGPNETPEETDALNKAYVVVERYEARKEAFNRLFALRYRFMALFGSAAGKPIEELQSLLNKVFLAAHMLPRLWRDADRAFRHRDEERRRRHLELMEKLERDFWATFGPDDELDKMVEEVVRNTEAVCEPILRPTSHPRYAWQKACALWQRLRRRRGAD